MPPTLDQLNNYLPPELVNTRKDLYFANWEILNLGAGATASDDFLAPPQSAILALMGVATVTDAATDRVLQAFFAGKAVITDSSNRNLMSEAVHFNNLFGTAQLPALYPWPKLVDAGSIITIAVTNLTGAAVNVRMTWWGFKLFAGAA